MQVGINYYQNYDFVRDFTDKPMSTEEAMVSCAAKDAIDVDGTLIIVFTSSGPHCDAAQQAMFYFHQYFFTTAF